MLEKLDRQDFDKIFEIMQASFPKDEYRTYEGQKALLDMEKYNVVVTRHDKKIVAFICYWADDDIAFIEHFAVSPSIRGHGLGGAMLGELLCSLRGKMVCLEAEPPDNDTAARRIAFYERNGFHLNAHPYMQPSLANGRSPVQLMIMTSDRRVNAEEFLMLKKKLYESFYKDTTNS